MMYKSFREKVIFIIKKIPQAQVASYGQIALLAGSPRAARQVGWILNSSSEKENLPWWRVINNSGKITIKHSEITAQMQKELLEKEGVRVSDLFEIDIEKYRWKMDTLFKT